MRADLNKLLCEHERHGHSRSYKDVRHNKKFDTPDADGELPSRESMVHRHARAQDTKSFSDNLNPLWGLIRKAVGRRWDTFYSELSKAYDRRSTVNNHIFEHLVQGIELDAFIRDGQVWIKNTYAGDLPLRQSSSTEFYVDPRDGIIKKNKFYKRYSQQRREQKAREVREEAKVTCWIDDDNVLRKIGDVWFHFTLEDVPQGEVIYTKPDCKELFDTGFGQRPNQMRPWDMLTDYQQRRHGVRSFKGQTVVDVFSGHSLMFDRRTNRVVSSRDNWHNPKRYHATKRTASHKQLKQAGVI